MASRLATLLALVMTVAGAVAATSSPPAAPAQVTLPSAEPSGDPTNDRIWLAVYPAAAAAGQRTPAVVLLHPLGDIKMAFIHRFARYLAARGIAGAVMTLPYHARRRPPGERPIYHFGDPDLVRGIQAMSQSASDVGTAVTWLRRQPAIDPGRVGVIGVSLGAILAHLAMGKDARLTAGVAILGGGDLLDVRRSGLLGWLPKLRPRSRLDADLVQRLRRVDPIAYADRNRPRRVLMVQAARDLLVPPRDVRELWNALGRPPIVWADTNHYALALVPRSVMRTASAYLQSVWRGAPLDARALPPIRPLTLKAGTLVGLDSRATPAFQWQVHSFSTRPDHMSRLHLDLGWSGRGPFAGVALTQNAYMDAGLAHRFKGHGIRPYLSLHLVF